MRLLPTPEVSVANAADAFDPAGTLTDERARTQVRALMANLLDRTKRVGEGSPAPRGRTYSSRGTVAIASIEGRP